MTIRCMIPELLHFKVFKDAEISIFAIINVQFLHNDKSNKRFLQQRSCALQLLHLLWSAAQFPGISNYRIARSKLCIELQHLSVKLLKLILNSSSFPRSGTKLADRIIHRQKPHTKSCSRMHNEAVCKMGTVNSSNHVFLEIGGSIEDSHDNRPGTASLS